MTTSGPGNAPGTSSDQSSTSELLRALSEDIRTLVARELRDAQMELTGKARQATRAVALLGGAAALGTLAAGTSAALLTRTLDRFLPPAASALVATAVYGGGAAALASLGVAELRRLPPLVSPDVVAGARADVRAATRAAGTQPGTPA